MTEQKRLLVCDDSDLVYSGLKSMLEKIPQFQVVGHARNGAECLRLAEELSPDLVLMDLSMPVMDGIEATAKMKQAFPPIRVLIVTSNEAVDALQKCLLAGADGYCSKAVLTEQLVTAISSVCVGATWLSPVMAEKLKGALSVAHPVARRVNETRLPTENLSQREREVLELMYAGLSNSEIASRLYLSKETVKTHVRRIYEKLAVRHRTEAVVEAIRRGLVSAA